MIKFMGPKIRFNCVLCGECCRRYWITVTLDDLVDIYLNLGLLPSSVSALYPKAVAGDWGYPAIKLCDGREYYLVLRKKLDGSCIFTKWVNGGLICSIHNYKPLTCRYYPYIYRPGSVVTMELYDGAIGYCPGIGKGNYYDLSREAATVALSISSKKRLEEFVSKWNKEDAEQGDLSTFMKRLDEEVMRLAASRASSS